MKSKIVITLGFVFFSLQGFAYNITATIDGLKKGDACLLAYYYAGKTYIKDTAYVEPNGTLTFSRPEQLVKGVYLVVMPDKSYFEVLIGEVQDFGIATTANDPTFGFTDFGTIDNKVFYEFVLASKKVASKEEYDKMRQQLAAKYPGTFAIKFLQMGWPLSFSTHLDSQGKDITYYVYRDHYFDYVDFSEPYVLRHPNFIKRYLYEYIDYLPQHADSIKAGIDKILSMAQANDEVFKACLITLFNTFATYENALVLKNITGNRDKISTPFDIQEVYCYIGHKYYLTGKASWVSTEDFNNISSALLGEKCGTNKSNPVKEKAKEFVQQATQKMEANRQTEPSAPPKTIAELYKTTAIDVDENIPVSAAKQEHVFALVIGNEDYTTFQSGLETEANVDYAANDAKVVKAYFENTLSIPTDNITLLVNATAGQMLQAIDKLKMIANVLPGEAEFIIYYAGHGLPDEVTKEAYLMPVDISGSSVTRGIKLKDLYSDLLVNKPKRVTVLLDACFSGGARNQGLLAARGVRIKPNNEYITGQLVVLTSSSGSESSLPYHDKKHGLFTYFLLKKLQETKGDVDLKTLSDYLVKQVKLNSILHNNKPQTPQVNVSTALQDEWGNWKLR